MLVLHIGLPKTGTTFLQHLFRRTPDLAFVHRKMGEREGDVCRELRRLARTNRLLALVHARRIGARVRDLVPASRSLLISDEDISVAAGGFWRGAGPEPQLVARRLAALEPPGSASAPVRVMIGIRQQDQWLASRYAESSRMFPEFGQSDFEARMRRIAAGASLAGPLQWLDYLGVREIFARALGPDNVLLVPLERLAADAGDTLAEVGRFLGGVDLGHAFLAMHRSKRRTQNRLATGENTWRMRRDGSPLRLEPDLQAALRQRFAESNRALAAVQPLGFQI